MNTNRKLVGWSLIAAIILSLLPYSSLEIKGQQASANAQGEPVLVGQVVQNRTTDEELSKHFHKYDLIRMDPAAAAAQVRKSGRLLLKSSAGDFDLKMAPNDLRSVDYVAQVIDSTGARHLLPKTEVQTYKGYVKGLPDAQARMSLTERGIEGAIITKKGRYFLQPARSISKQARSDEFVLYESADLEKHDSTCGVTVADEVAAQQEVAKIGATEIIEAEASGPVSSLSPMKIVRIATDADAEYVTAFGGASQANTQILNILNFVEGIYESELGLTFEIVQQNTWADANTDPYTLTGASERLGQFRNHWNANFVPGSQNAPPRSIAHLFTGVDLGGPNVTTIGIASFGVTCRNPNFSYGLSQKFPFQSNSITARTVVLTAHEIGHNFGASHTNQVSSEIPADLESACEETIMEASVGDGSSFCPFSRSQIAGWANAFSSCLIDTASAPPTSQDCVTTPLVGPSASGTLSGGDCRSPSRGVEHFADRYSFNGNAGQRVSITMNQTGGGLDPYLYLIGPDGYFVAQNDDSSDVSVNSRLPLSGSITLPYTGVYIVEATSFARLQTGSYTITVSDSSCSISVSPGSFHFPAGGGNGTVNVTLTGCASDNSYQFTVFPATVPPWVVPETTSASGSRGVNFTVQANSSSAGRRAFLVVGRQTTGGTELDPVFGGGLRIPITQSGTGPDCSSTSIGFGQTLNGQLASGDCHSPVRGGGLLADRYTFNAAAGQKVIIQTSAQVGNPDTFLTLLGPTGVVLITDDDSGGGTTNSRIPGGNGSLTLGLTGTYTIEVSGFAPSDAGPYSLTLTGSNVVAPPLQILLEENGPTANQAAAFDSILWVRDPFPIVNTGNLLNPPSDPNTRVVIFVASLSPSAPVLVNLLDNNNQSHNITPQDVRTLPNTDFTQVTFRLPSNLAVGPCRVTVISNAVSSNTAIIRIK